MGTASRVAYYTAGSTGAGHLVRGLAIRRALARRGFTGAYRMFGPRLPFELAKRDDYEVVRAWKHELESPEAAPQTEFAGTLRDFRADVMLVDMFWPQVRYILPSLGGVECWLLLRSHPPSFLEGTKEVPFDATQYARVLAIEPIPHSPLVTMEPIDPIVVCNPDERRPRGELRARLGVVEGELLHVTMHAGIAEPLEGVPAGARELSLLDGAPLFPVAEWLGDADGVWCGAGYNSYWESRWLGYQDKVHFTALERKIDDQAWRMAECGGVEMKGNGADWLAREILG